MLVMGSIRTRDDTGKLYIDFRYHGERCREQTSLTDTRTNRHKLEKLLQRMEAEITLGTFDYRRYFPTSVMAAKFETQHALLGNGKAIPSFSEFVAQWFVENTPRWKRSMQSTVECNLRVHLNPYFGELPIHVISKADILGFRAELAKLKSSGRHLSNDRINHLMTTLRMIINDASDRMGFVSPWQNIRPLPIPRTEVEPFTLGEVQRFIANVREDFRNYYTVRFFTAMRTGEIDGLKWEYVDFEKRLILVRETIVEGRPETPKTSSSYRDIHMPSLVFDALRKQEGVTRNKNEYVFCARNGATLSHRNITRRIWHPTLKQLGFKKRRPYQTRHTCATLWLAAGENPEWIARQMGHANTKMLFERYSRFVPNLTRQDGSAFERLLVQKMIR